MIAPALSGPQYLHEGLSLILKPGLRSFVILPVSINLLVFIALISYSITGFSGWLNDWMATIPSWLSFLEIILWPIFVLALIAVIFFTFTTLTSIIAAPFYGLLSEKVEVVVRGHNDFPPFSSKELIAMVPRTMGREMRKLAYFLPRALLLLILWFIPVINILAGPLWILLGVWMMAVQYIDYPADNHKLSWGEMLAWLRQRRWQSLSFGGITYLYLLVPIFNLIVMPAAVAGATLYWVHEHNRQQGA